MEPEIEVAVATATTAVDALSSTLAAVATATAAAASSTASADGPMASSSSQSDQGDCELLGPFALLVQLALGGLALLSLVYKRWRERPQRPLKIWFFDVSKQVFGSVLVHGANVFMSMLTSGSFTVNEMEAVSATAPAARLLRRATGDDGGYVPNPCSWYLLNLAIDTTLGIPILILLLRIVTGLVSLTPLGKPRESIQSGNYGNPPNKWWWLKQSIIYFIGLFGMKICVLVLFLLMPWISRAGDWALGWTEGNEKLQIAFVMMIFPLIMNGLQYYIIDSFIKMQSPDKDTHERLPSEDPDERRHRRRLSGDTDLDGVLSDDDDDDTETGRGHKKVFKAPPPRDDEYDPEVDGEARTVAGSGSSSRPGTDTSPPTLHPTPDLYPKE